MGPTLICGNRLARYFGQEEGEIFAALYFSLLSIRGLLNEVVMWLGNLDMDSQS